LARNLCTSFQLESVTVCEAETAALARVQFSGRRWPSLLALSPPAAGLQNTNLVEHLTACRSRSPAHQGDYVRDVLTGLHVSQFLLPREQIPFLHPEDRDAGLRGKPCAIAGCPASKFHC
jgi:hypothetical protein